MHRVLLAAAEEHSQAGADLPVAPEIIGLLGFGVLASLLLVTYAFRSVGTRH